ncbi:gamma-glutamylcyclotransferase family protein [Streptomyces sp. FL07-04A]|uniref:gamma-glutamylcyclotransferase family protein n=1 Tax=Streptomyces sp. FL07-04A TaxID=3028658 RepID=UPI0029AB6B94|nr:gamma-glutamylcyclotransferase family protein [Streptomyces sp. FL07-04A]MDX3576775.1 gamma-glutamylcyclotransferase [Streptomyces sp. FL07-04A]
MTAPALPFFVYGTLRPGQVNHDLFLHGRTVREEPARLPGAVLYDGPGYPYAVEEPGEAGSSVAGDLVTARPEAYAQLLAALDRLEQYAPGDPRNLYERVAREVTARAAGGAPVRAWVYVAAPAVAAGLRARGKPIAGGDWLTRR